MKIIQTGNQIQTSVSGISQVIVGSTFSIVGVVLSIVEHHVPNNNHATTVTNASGTTTTSAHAGLFILLFGLIFFIVGVLLVIFSKSRVVTIVKDGDTTVSTKRIIGGHQVSASVQTKDVRSVRLSTYMDNMNGNGGTRRSQLELVLLNNDIIQVASKSANNARINGISVGSLIGKAPLQKEAQQLADFLGVPIDSADTSSISGMIKTAKQVFQTARTENNESIQSNPSVQATHLSNTVPPTSISPSDSVEQVNQTPQPTKFN